MPVLDPEGKVAGIVTEFDLLKAIMEDKALLKVTAGEPLTPNPHTVTPDTTAPELIRLLEDNYLIRMPVVDAKGRLCPGEIFYRVT